MGRSEQQGYSCSDARAAQPLFHKKETPVLGAYHQMTKATTNASGATTRPR
jgi:hypothetical protein